MSPAKSHGKLVPDHHHDNHHDGEDGDGIAGHVHDEQVHRHLYQKGILDVQN